MLYVEGIKFREKWERWNEVREFNRERKYTCLCGWLHTNNYTVDIQNFGIYSNIS